MTMPVEQPVARRPGILVYGLMVVIACCLPALLLTSVL